MTAQVTAEPSDFVDLDKYPLDGRDPRRYRAAGASLSASELVCL